MMETIQAFLENESTAQKLNGEQKKVLESLCKKFNQKINQLYGNKIDEKEFAIDSPKEKQFICNALQYIISGKVFNGLDEDKSIFELAIQKTQIIKLNFEVSLGFEDRLAPKKTILKKELAPPSPKSSPSPKSTPSPKSSTSPKSQEK